MFLRGLYPLGISAGCLPSIKFKFTAWLLLMQIKFQSFVYSSNYNIFGVTETWLSHLSLGLPHYMSGVTTGTLAVGNEIQLLCS